MEKKFSEIVKAMSGKDIVMAMVNGLKAKHVEIDMDTYGDTRDNICFGCAATNTICEIRGKAWTVEDKLGIKTAAELLVGGDVFNLTFSEEQEKYFIDSFEVAMDYLRKGYFGGYNCAAKCCGFSELPPPTFQLPTLTTENYLENLKYYEDYANSL